MLIDYGKLLHDRAHLIGVDWVAMEDIHPWYLECWKKGVVGVGKTIRPLVQWKTLINESIEIAKALLDDGRGEGGEVKGVGWWPANWR